MNRGGRRVGAGRKPRLDLTERIYLGSICESRFQQLWQAARQQRWDDRPGVSEVHGLHAKAQSIPLEDRGRFLASAEGRQHADDIDFSIREIRGTPTFVEETNRIFNLEAPRPKEVKSDICKAIAGEVRHKWGLAEIGSRYIQRCWDEYRAFEKETRPAD